MDSCSRWRLQFCCRVCPHTKLRGALMLCACVIATIALNRFMQPPSTACVRQQLILRHKHFQKRRDMYWLWRWLRMRGPMILAFMSIFWLTPVHSDDEVQEVVLC